jgi:hypothetical protein
MAVDPIELSSLTLVPQVLRQAVPAWFEDGFQTEQAWEDHNARVVEELYEESVQKWGPKKYRWKRADKLVELEHLIDEFIDYRNSSRGRLPILAPAIEEFLAVRHQDPLRPTANSRQQALNEAAAACNAMLSQILDANLYNLLRLRIGLDQLKFGIGFLNPVVDAFRAGMFDNNGEHIINRIDPRYVWPDAYADSWDFKRMKYCIIARPMDRSDIIRKWPTKGWKVKPGGKAGARALEQPEAAQVNGGRVESPFNRSSLALGGRDRHIVLECYLFDARVRQVPANKDGDPIFNPDGSEVTRWDERYPKGRLMVACNGVMLQDGPNPFNHGTVPLVAYQKGVRDQLFSYSPIELLDLVDRWMAPLLKEAYDNCRAWMNSPWAVDWNAFLKPEQYKNLSWEPDQIFLVKPNSRVARIPPSDLPQSVFMMFDKLKNIFDQVLGVNNVSRGDLQEGAQLAADTVQGLQGAALKRVLLEQELDKEATKQLGHQIIQNIRQFYTVPVEFTIKDPLGQDKKYKWDNTLIKSDWDIGVEAGNTAGAEVSTQQRAAELYKMRAIDDIELLKTLRWPNPEDVVQRKRQWLVQLAQMGIKDGSVSRGPASKVPNV